MAKTMKKLDSKLQKQQQGWPKITNTAKKIKSPEIKRAREASSEFVKFKIFSCLYY